MAKKVRPRAAVNYHFGSKSRLYIETVRHAHECSNVGEELPRWPVGTPPLEKLRGFIAVMVSRMHPPTRPTSLQLVMREFTLPTEATREVVKDSIQPMAFTLREIIRELMPNLGNQERLMIGFSIIGQVLYYRQNRAVSELLFGTEEVNAITVSDVTEHVTQMTFASLGFGPPIGSVEHAKHPLKPPTTAKKGLPRNTKRSDRS